MKADVIIIGGGVIGTVIARELSCLINYARI
jgi:L-2-hydroxyglutarate oxidase LhgO